MCVGGNRNPPQQETITPVRQAVSSGDELAPTIELASEDAMEIAKKKKSKKGTIGMQTDLQIPGSSQTII
jgi:hypothetical protein